MDSIIFEVDQYIAKITLNRPDSLNSFTREMAFLLQEKLAEVEKNESARVIYITGNGKGFCAGQDVTLLVEEQSVDLTRILEEEYNPIIRKIRSIEKPVVCGVNGVAAGAGANLALACDITIASESSTFVQAFSRIGLIPDCGGTYTLPRLVGWQRAAALMMLGEPVTAKEAVGMGMIYKAIRDKRFATEVEALLQKMASMPPKSLSLIKRALNYSYSNNLENQLAIEEQLQSIAAQTEDFKEGIKAFVEKRTPSFIGK